MFLHLQWSLASFLVHSPNIPTFARRSFQKFKQKKLKKNLQYQHTGRVNNLTLQEFKASARIVQGMHASKPVGQDAFWLPCHTAATTQGLSTTPQFPY